MPGVTRILQGWLVSALLLAGSAWADGPGPVINMEGSRAAGLDQCVEPTGEMRTHHMQFLLHQRDLTMYEGIRTRKHSLAECVDCHVRKDPRGQFVPINEEEEFCDTCHDFASVRIDCFECHATVPRTPTRSWVSGFDAHAESPAGLSVLLDRYGPAGKVGRE